jgi:hypothetical protein
MKDLKFLDFKILSLILLIILILSLSANFILSKKGISSENQEKIETSELGEEKIAKQASAQEIYPLFECPCCGKAINECSCGMAKERMAFIDGLTAREVSEQEAVLTYVKKYGLTSFMEQEKEDEFRDKLIAQAPDERPIISLNPDSYDFEEVSQKKGTVTTLFEIKNNGQSDLIIERLETSCGCTSASIVYQDQEGPKFNMPGHGINEEIGDWQIAITPNMTAQLKVYYDPNMHPEFRGTATRTVSIFSNDPIDFQKEVTIELNQVD